MEGNRYLIVILFNGNEGYPKCGIVFLYVMFYIAEKLDGKVPLHHFYLTIELLKTYHGEHIDAMKARMVN